MKTQGKDERLIVRMSPAQLEALKWAAKAEGTSVSSWIREAAMVSLMLKHSGDGLRQGSPVVPAFLAD